MYASVGVSVSAGVYVIIALESIEIIWCLFSTFTDSCTTPSLMKILSSTCKSYFEAKKRNSICEWVMSCEKQPFMLARDLGLQQHTQTHSHVRIYKNPTTHSIGMLLSMYFRNLHNTQTKKQNKKQQHTFHYHINRFYCHTCTMPG